MTTYEQLQTGLRAEPRRWLVTGAAGFIGSNLVESLLKLGQHVTGLDDLSTGNRNNLDQVQAAVTASQWAQFLFVQETITHPAACHHACIGAEFILHQAALGSVPYSIKNPDATHAANVTGFLNMLEAARSARTKRFVFASSSAVYGDDAGLPKVEDRIGNPLSPYATTKRMDEMYADVFARCYGMETVGLRYFNVFGPRQDPNGAYAAVIPKWVDALLRGEPPHIHGDGETSRDFCHVDNVVQANLLAALTTDASALNQPYNIALGSRTTLNELFDRLQTSLQQRRPALKTLRPIHGPERAGDIRHSLADISKASQTLGYKPLINVTEGIERAMDWYCANASR